MGMKGPLTRTWRTLLLLSAVAYLRRSTDRQEQSLDDQRTAIKVYAAERGLPIIREYVDDAISGSTSEGRDAFQRLIADAQRANPDFDIVLVYDVKVCGRSRGDG